jgi:glycerol-3-phosphate O-acyltransferase/dihydroxyacetone phosphate acyltransferase
MLYQFLKLLIQTTLWFFYRDLKVNGKSDILSSGPLIVAVNHPNTLMDPLVVSSYLSQRTGFIGKSTLMANGFVKWLFKILHIIPIQRKVDAQNGQANTDNSKSFEKCYEYLGDKGTIVIFPEGNSFHEMKLRPLKTGTARIALEFEAKNDFKGGLKILPIALNYSDPALFRSDLTINVGKAISIAQYKEEYLKDPIETVRKLTDDLKNQLEKLILVANHPEQELLYKRIQNIYGEQLNKGLNLEEKSTTDFSVSKEISNALIYFEEQHPELYSKVDSKINQYTRLVDSLNIQEKILIENPKSWKRFFQRILIPFYMALFFPVYIAGLITNYLPYIIPSKIARMVSREIEYRAPVMMLTGLLVFPLFYYVECLLFQKFVSGITWHVLVFLFSLPLLGFYTLHYYSFFQWSKSKFFQLYMTKEKVEIYKRLASYRQEIIDLLENAKTLYQQRT